jgi:hypothetical protein
MPAAAAWINPSVETNEVGTPGVVSQLDSVGTSMGVQQKLMRHAQIATTMNVYGDAMMESKRAANSSSTDGTSAGTEGSKMKKGRRSSRYCPLLPLFAPAGKSSFTVTQ